LCLEELEGRALLSLIPIATTGYNEDVVVEAAAGPNPAQWANFVTGTVDSGHGDFSHGTFYEAGLPGSPPGTGLPAGGGPIVSALDPNTTFQLQPYNALNALQLRNGETGTLTLTTPAVYDQLAFFGLSTNTHLVPGGVSLTIHFADGTPNLTGLGYRSPDWSFPLPPSPFAFLPGAILNPPDSFPLLPASNGIEQFTVALPPGSNHPISSIDLTYSGNGLSSTFAVSGELPGASARFVGADTTTQGNWKGVYGQDGFDVSQDPSPNNPTLPAYAALSFTGNFNWNWPGSNSDPRDLQLAAPGSTGRIAALWGSATSFSIDVKLTDGQVHRLALYALDWDSYMGGRSERIDLIDDANGAVLDSRTIHSFQNGEYLVWNVTGSVTIEVTNLNPASNAVLSGLFLG
jgi:hypothetical protein